MFLSKLHYSSVCFELNSGKNNGGGFFSVFFFLCEAYIHAKKNKLPFYIEHHYWPYTFQHGWHDYFTTLKLNPKSPNISLKCSHMTLHPDWKYTLQDFKDAIHEIFVPNHFILNRVREITQELKEYIGVFVRRGDKITQNEASLIPVSDILKHITYTSSTTFFIQSDDYTVVEEFQHELPNHKIVSIVSPTKRGSWHSKAFRFNASVTHTLSIEEKPKDIIFKETQDMIIGLLVCLHAKECWSDDTSNVGRFLKLYSPTTVKVYPSDYNLNMGLTIHPAWTVK